ncbi:hypothetical protein SSX86_010587 [Deinandra increscens subsp. villosa]|uniref:Reverse transcriptase domain-containing protein n=1 Tax=Deinandra increscens subsp. villosa TaxID=3103831 RepID=A0AAP0DCT4_9ASTR
MEKKVNFMCIQETKATDLNFLPIRQLWGISEVRFEGVEAQGRSGGILSLWNPSVFRFHNSLKNPNFLLISGSLVGGQDLLNIVNVYAPQDLNCKRRLWHTFLNLMANGSGMWVFVGDFNEVRCPEERKFSRFNSRGAHFFNEFIAEGNLHEYGMGGSKFTFSYGKGKNFSKLDRVLVSKDFFELWPAATLTAMPRLWSDHSPIILKVSKRDFGPVPFRFFSSWLKNDDLVEEIRSVLAGQADASLPPDLGLRDKLRKVKDVIKAWRNRNKNQGDKKISELTEVCNNWDRISEDRELQGPELEEWIIKKEELQKLEDFRVSDLRQKARVKWAIEGDENSAFFHGVINANMARGRINGISAGGIWVEDPNQIKEAARGFFKNLLGTRRDRPDFMCCGINAISNSQREELIQPFARMEIKNAIWDCEGDKAPGPDGFNFSFIKFFWGELEGDFVKMMNYFYETGTISQGCASSFIHLIPKSIDAQSFGEYRPISLLGVISKVISKVLAERMKKVLKGLISECQMGFVAGRNIVDGPMIVNEVVSWLKYAKKKGLLFKVDFRKAYDSLDWKYIDTVLFHMNFPDKWRVWVQGVLQSARASVLINGSPSKEFNCLSGVRQGDPLSPYLFVVAMEGLSWMFQKAEEQGVFHGLRLPNNGPVLSKLFYADDAMFLGEWTDSNALNLVRLLRVFFLVSGLKVNFHKSALFGVNVEDGEIKRVSDLMQCLEGRLPFGYLGMMVGANMNRRQFWEPVVETFERRLSRWKANSLSFGGRITLAKSVLESLPSYYFSLYKAPKNVIELLDKIRMRFLWGGSENRKKIHWVKKEEVCKPIKNGGLGLVNLEYSNLSLLCKWIWRLKDDPNRMWCRVIESIHKVRNRGEFLPCKVSIPGVWKNVIGAKKILQNYGVVCEQLMEQNGSSWVWNRGLGEGFSAKQVRVLLEDREVRQPVFLLKWSRLVPLKVNAFVWRAQRGRIGTLDNLKKRGVQVESEVCKLCRESNESVTHLFTGCMFAAILWQWVMSWFNLPNFFAFSLDDILRAHSDVGIHGDKKEILHGVILTACWCLWKERNEVAFHGRDPNVNKVICNTKIWCKIWLNNRSRKCIDWAKLCMV